MALIDWVIAYRKFDEASWDTADSSGNGYTLTNIWTAVYSAGKLWNWVSTVPWKYLKNDTFLDGWLADRTCCYRLKTTNSVNSFLVDKTSSWLPYPFEHRIQADGTLVLTLDDDNTFNTPSVRTTASAVNDWNWHFIVLEGSRSWGRASIKISVDNVSNGSLTTSWTVDSGWIYADGTYDFTVMVRGDLSEGFTWQIDELWFWNRVLSAWEKTSIYNWWTWITYPFTPVAAQNPNNMFHFF